MRVVKFTRHHAPYNAGETAGFDAKVAEGFVKRARVAEYADDNSSDDDAAGGQQGEVRHIGGGRFHVVVDGAVLEKDGRPEVFKGKAAAQAALDAALAATPPAPEAGAEGGGDDNALTAE